MNKPKNVNRLFFFMFLSYILFTLAVVFFKISLGVTGSLLFGQAVFLLPCVIYLLVCKIPIRVEIPFHKIKISTILMIILFTILIYPLMSFLNVLSMLFATNHVNEMTSMMNGDRFLFNLLLMAVVPAVSEEFMFRGIFFGAYKKRGVLFGALAGGLIFGMAHMNLNQFSYAFALGFVMCILVEVTGSIFASMLMHFLINGWSVVALWGQQFLENTVSKAAEQLGQTAGATTEVTTEFLAGMIVPLAIVALVCTALAACVLVWISKNCHRESYLKEIFKKSSLKRTNNDILYEGSNYQAGNKILTPFFMINVVLVFGFMIYLN